MRQIESCVNFVRETTHLRKNYALQEMLYVLTVNKLAILLYVVHLQRITQRLQYEKLYYLFLLMIVPFLLA
jgi:hypothetical protein